MSESKKILIVDDEEDIIEFLTYNLENQGFIVEAALDGEEGIQKAKQFNPDLILLDVMMPKMDGIEVCQQLREFPQFKNTIISFLTARGEDYSQLAGFEAGADEYITKPIRPKVLVARVKALMRREHRVIKSEENNVTTIGNIKIDHEKMLVFKGGKAVQPTKKEFDLLVLLTSAPGKVFTREHIHKSLWGGDLSVGDRTMDVHIRKLRILIGQERIITLKGTGYKFNEL